jgi:hypothetical protein
VKWAEAVKRIRAGDKLHQQFVNGQRRWWFEAPHAEVSDATVMRLISEGQIEEAGDSLFGLPLNSQTWTDGENDDGPPTA